MLLPLQQNNLLGSSNKSLVADPGSFTFTGTDASVLHKWDLDLDAGAFDFTGTDAATKVGFKVVADPGSFAFTGVDASLRVTWSIDLDPGQYDWTGTDAALRAGFAISADAGSYSFDGVDAGLVTFGNKLLVADEGTFAFTGTDADALLLTQSLDLDPGSYDFIGVDADLIATGGEPVILDATEAGVYEWTGTDADLIVSVPIEAEAGSYAFTGSEPTLWVNAFSRRGAGVPEEPRRKVRRERERVLKEFLAATAETPVAPPVAVTPVLKLVEKEAGPLPPARLEVVQEQVKALPRDHIAALREYAAMVQREKKLAIERDDEEVITAYLMAG